VGSSSEKKQELINKMDLELFGAEKSAVRFVDDDICIILVHNSSDVRIER
jgi:hypothetical protein